MATATSSKAPLRPACKQHTAVDDLAGVVVDVEIVTGEEHDTGRFEARLDAIEDTLGVPPGRITADTIYGVGRVCAILEDRQIEAVIPPLRAPRRKGALGFPTEQFTYHPHHDVVRCPAKKRLTPEERHEIGSMVSRRTARLRALSPQGTVPAAGHPIPPGAHRDKPRSHSARPTQTSRVGG
jgi:hypothetical protein